MSVSALARDDPMWAQDHRAPSAAARDPRARPARGFDPLISLLYRGTIAAEPWKAFLEALREHFTSDYAALTVRPDHPRAAPLVILAKAPSLTVARAPSLREYARLAHLDPLAAALARPGDIYTLDEVVRWEDYRQTEFYSTIIAPYGVRHQLGMACAEPSGWRCDLGLLNTAGKPAFGGAEKAELLALLPHLESALAMYAQVRRRESERRLFEGALERLTIATLMIDGAGRVMDMNAMAKQLLRDSEDVLIVDGRLALRQCGPNRELQGLVRQACDLRSSRRAEASIDGLGIDRRFGARLGILVRSVGAADRFDSYFGPRAVVYMTDPDHQPTIPERFISRLFGLTQAESIVVKLLSSGMSLTQVASELDITENTARTYTKKIFAKVGVNRQSELVRLVLKSVAPLA